MAPLVELEQSQTNRILKILDNPDKASHLIFRLMGPTFQSRFAQALSLDSIPRVFIHGNPHLDNYVRTFTGSGMIDFDRSRMGPYAWDIIRFMASVAIRGAERNREKISNKTWKCFLDGYLASLHNTDIIHTAPTFVKTIIPSESQLSTNNYLAANIKWGKKMRKNKIDIENKKMKKFLRLYLESRSELDLLNFYELVECGKSEGSLGKMHFLFVLSPKTENIKKDKILIDIKETYQEVDNDVFSSPVDHHGLRMIKASNLYAPGVEQRLGYFTFENKHYWGREIPSFNAKIKELLSKDEQDELSYCVGSQFGRAHARSLRETSVSAINNDILENADVYMQMSEFINKQVSLSLDFLERSKNLNDELGKLGA